MKKYTFSTFYILFLFLFISCEKGYIRKDDSIEGEQSEYTGINEDEEDYMLDSAALVQIVLNGNYITADTSGVIVNGSIVTIKSAGTYDISGLLTNGQLIVNTEDEGDVKLILNNVNITCLTNPPLYISNAKKVIIFLPDNSENYLADGSLYQNLTEGEPNAVVFSKSDLSIYGNGSLTIDGNYGDGISCKDGLIIKSGTITVNSVDDGIRGKDYLLVHEGNIIINSGGDGLKSDNDSNDSLGFITIETGNFNIISGGDAVAALNVNIASGEFNITSGGGSGNSISGTISAKGIKASVNLTVDDGTFTINSADDAVNSNSDITINGGILNLSSGDDGIHADVGITINNCEVSITKSYEGIESASITVDNSTVSIIASDDGFNATFGMGGEADDNSILTINSGYVYVKSSSDALDSNGDMLIAGGTVIAHGPSSAPEVGIDCNGTCKVSGGILIVSGSNSNMTEAPSTSSTQYSVLIQFSSGLSANSIVHLQDNEGNDVLTFAPEKAYQSIIVSSSGLKLGSSYTIYTGGASTGTEINGLYSGGSYSGGTRYDTFTISGMVTILGTSSNSGGPGGRP
jgi:hypothetical protein